MYDSLTLWIKSRIVSSAICLNFIFKLFDLLLSPCFLLFLFALMMFGTGKEWEYFICGEEQKILAFLT